MDQASQVRQYGLITASYWAFTLTDGALRMLVVLFFHQLGYSPLEIAFLFVFYEAFGVVTNLVGGWLGAVFGLHRTMHLGLLLQIVALSMLLVPSSMLTLLWVMAAQALSGIAKDLNKMSAKSAIKWLVPDEAQSKLFRWVALLTGSKNTLKGVGFFVGGLLLNNFGFRSAILILALMLSAVWILTLVLLNSELGKSQGKPKFTAILSKSRTINYLSAARLFLFGARDVWFVVALPVTLSQQFNWSHTSIGSFIALWIIVYGLVQANAPRIAFSSKSTAAIASQAFVWAMLLSVSTFAIAFAMHSAWPALPTLVIGVFVFGLVFAVNSALHSYLIVSFASRQNVSLDVGFYYMANAIGRLIGTILSGYVYQSHGFVACLWVSGCFLLIAAALSLPLPDQQKTSSTTEI